ncbi:MAG: haloacid dehalogenase [Chloroflexi bacterium]|uniref:Haloacid dehalogenase n=1 Tax=Candidatus Chlorohelix allophototropha TaxID=3003348 RepID=A0A8T7M767_9CHLR|nr:haloacid dehalogenase [Chloroflexota bacterium]WJW69863.1 haloacid dehalogenase [Chloroflexota bacterium L227-S17]
MSDNSSAIEATISAIAARIEQKNAAREKALAESRQVIRNAANSIRALHRHEFEQAAEMLEQGRTLLLGLKNVLSSFPDIYWAGYVQDAQKEYSEARLTYALVRGEVLPLPETLGVEDAPYLNALAEAASELRRYILDLIRHGAEHNEECEKLLEKMDEVYSRLVTVDYPDVLTGGLRRTTDQLRGVLERTRGDLTLTLRQRVLELALARYNASVDGKL